MDNIMLGAGLSTHASKHAERAKWRYLGANLAAENAAELLQVRKCVAMFDSKLQDAVIAL
jgi:hypothetical protein